MDNALDAHSFLALGAWMLLQILTVPHNYYLPGPFEEDENSTETFTKILQVVVEPMEDPFAIISSCLLNLRSPLPCMRSPMISGSGLNLEIPHGFPDSSWPNMMTRGGWKCSG